jgi:hypothetical protein
MRQDEAIMMLVNALDDMDLEPDYVDFFPGTIERMEDNKQIDEELAKTTRLTLQMLYEPDTLIRFD